MDRTRNTIQNGRHVKPGQPLLAFSPPFHSPSTSLLLSPFHLLFPFCHHPSKLLTRRFLAIIIIFDLSAVRCCLMPTDSLFGECVCACQIPHDKPFISVQSWLMQLLHQLCAASGLHGTCEAHVLQRFDQMQNATWHQACKCVSVCASPSDTRIPILGF